ncbi:MAG: Smr/MutS family protein [Vescimonas sp.]
MKAITRELNLELGRPTADEALRRLEAELEAARHMNTPLLKLIHGYGSSGKGGRIRTASRKYLLAQQEKGRIAAVVPGNGLASSMRPPAGPCSSIPICGRTGIWSGRTWA